MSSFVLKTKLFVSASNIDEENISKSVTVTTSISEVEINTSGVLLANTEVSVSVMIVRVVIMFFNTNDDISVVQIFDGEGELIFQLPVMSDNVQIKKNLFDSGEYKLGFVLEGETEVHLTDVTIR